MSTPTRTIRNLWRVGIKGYFQQMNAGTLIGMDRFGNKYYENFEEELPLRTKWVDYKRGYFDASEIEPGWHAWLHYMADKPPTQDPLLQPRTNKWSPADHIPNPTMSRAAYKPYSTVRQDRIQSWAPVAKPREASA
ncbi:NADH ubiquinone oxidoreductase subunit NDUFA12-domain-containing protein [Tirmania nivea]|nr:NADH ubiquinone oxidoreductase subunit NDUFA12-domain-containing protein [Tirmania nivea]